MRALAFVVLVAALSGCVAPPKLVRAYAGPPRPDAEIAVVRAARHGGILPGEALNVAAIRVDGTPVPTGSWIWQAPPDIHLEPGTHVLTLAIDEGGSMQSLSLPQAVFRAEPGRVYELRGEKVPGSFELGFLESTFAWRWSIVDTATGTVVAHSEPAKPGNP